ncbi:MAG: hypothetical protein K8R88_09485 [Armatimonadetes bacterium]|nr:hypothetical protein [Armatimonadota bacterium]
MSAPFYPTRESEVLEFVSQMREAISVAPTEFGLTAGQVAVLGAKLAQWNADYTAALAAESARLAAVATKNESLDDLLRYVQMLNKKVQSEPTVTAAQKLTGGFSVPQTNKTSVLPHPVTELNVKGYDTGINKLRWTRSGNKPTVMFGVCVSYDKGLHWEQIAVVTKTKFEHTGQTPGRTAWYKVTAYTPTATAPASNIAITYAQGNLPQLQLSA